MACKRVHAVRFDGHTVSVVETESHRLFVNNLFAGECIAKTVRVSPHAKEEARKAVAAFAAIRGWAIA